MAMVTFDFGLVLIDLANISSPPNVANPLLNVVGTHTDDFQRKAVYQADSLEMTHDRAVVIGYKLDPLTWSVKDFCVSQSTDPILRLDGEFTGEDLIPHDLAINVAADAAIIKLGAPITGGNLVLSNLSTTTPSVTGVPSNGTPYRDWGPGPHARVSDSALTVSLLVGGVRKDYGITIGGSTPLPLSGVTEIVDLAAPSLVASHVSGDPDWPTMPTDLDVSTTMKRVFVRCEAAPDEDASQAPTSGRDLMVVNLGVSPPVLEVGGGSGAFIGGQGLIRSQVDSMLINRSRAISIAEHDPNVVPTPTGYVHTSTNP